MIRPQKFSETAARYRTNRSKDFISFGDHFLSRYRWTSTLLVIGDCDGEYEDCLCDFFPDAIPTYKRLHTLKPEFYQQHRNHFNIVLVHTDNSDVQLSLFKSLKPVVRVGGLMAVEGVWPEYRSQFEAEQCRWEGSTAIFNQESY